MSTFDQREIADEVNAHIVNAQSALVALKLTGFPAEMLEQLRDHLELAHRESVSIYNDIMRHLGEE